MATIVDTSFLFALANKKDVNHEPAVQTAMALDDLLVLPLAVLPEICYLLDSRLSHTAMRLFVRRVLAGDMRIESPTRADMHRASEILQEYADARVDFVDATIVALAERLGIVRVLTFDRRHFTLFRPRHCTHFELLPE